MKFKDLMDDVLNEVKLDTSAYHEINTVLSNLQKKIKSDFKSIKRFDNMGDTEFKKAFKDLKINMNVVENKFDSLYKDYMRLAKPGMKKIEKGRYVKDPIDNSVYM